MNGLGLAGTNPTGAGVAPDLLGFPVGGAEGPPNGAVTRPCVGTALQVVYARELRNRWIEAPVPGPENAMPFEAAASEGGALFRDESD